MKACQTMHQENRRNNLGQPIGSSLNDWTPPKAISEAPMSGRFCRLERLSWSNHGESLFQANNLDVDGAGWTYLSYGPYSEIESYRAWVAHWSSLADPMFFAIIDLERDRAIGVASFMRQNLEMGSIEVGHIHFSPLLQRTAAATEAMHLMMKRAFDAGFRRYEWKCDALNAGSRAAAERLGFTFEGIFRQAAVYKQRSRDTAWFSIIDNEWPALDSAFNKWLSHENFHQDGSQRSSLQDHLVRSESNRPV